MFGFLVMRSSLFVLWQSRETLYSAVSLVGFWPCPLIKSQWLGLGILLLLFLISAWLLFLMFRIYTYSPPESPSHADAAVVLGAVVWDDSPSPVFEQRIKHAINLYETGRIQFIVFTGSATKGESYAESDVAKNYAIQYGISPDHIFHETVSENTWQNLLEARRIYKQQNWSRILIVSDPLHMRRAMTIARDLGVNAYPSPTKTSRYRSWRTKMWFLLRETYYYVLYLLSSLFRPELW